MIALDAELMADLYAHADGNVGNGCWDLYDKYAARLTQSVTDGEAELAEADGLRTLHGAAWNDATAVCGAQEWMGDPYEAGVEFTCSLSAGHEGWHRDAGEHDEYRWEGPSDD